MLQQPHPSLCQPPAPGSSLQLKACGHGSLVLDSPGRAAHRQRDGCFTAPGGPPAVQRPPPCHRGAGTSTSWNPEKGPWYAGQGLELLLLQAPAHSDPVTPLPRHLGEKSPGQVPGTTYTAQCNGVKGFPSRYANGLCSSNNSRQSSCPVRREGHKHISAQPAMEQEGTEGLSSSPHDQREAPGSWGETAQTRSLNRGLKS